MPLFWLSAAFVAGLVIAASVPLSVTTWGALAAACLLAALLELRLSAGAAATLPPAWYVTWQRIGRLPLALVLAALCLGGLRTVSARPVWTENDLPWFNAPPGVQGGARGSFRLSGVVQYPPEVRDTVVTLVVAVDQLTPLVDGQAAGDTLSLSGARLARVSLRAGETWHYGDRVEMEGTPQAPNSGDGSSYPDYLSRQGIETVLEFPNARRVGSDQGSPFWAWIFDLRQLAERTLRQLLPQPEAALLAGVLLGSDQDLPESVVQAFRSTGIAHIIAVSGFNVAIVSGLFVTYLGRLLRARYAAPLAILGIAFYAILTGGSPSVVRAAIMGGVGVFGPLLGRRQVGVNSLAFTAGAMCLLDPQMPWNISFQLSFAASLGLVLYAEPMQHGFTAWLERRLAGTSIGGSARTAARWVSEFLLFTLAAQIFTLPVTAVHFQRISLSAVLVNPLVLPLQPPIMALGGLALIVGLAFAPLGQLLAWLCWPLLAYTIRVAELFARLPYSQVNLGRLSPALIFLYYVALVILILPSVRRRMAPLWKPATAVALAGLLAVGLWRGAAAAPDGRLHLEVINLPGGAAVYVRAPDGQTWLMNSSTQIDALSDALGRRQSPLENRLDGVLVTDHAAAPLQTLAQLSEVYTVNWLGRSAYLPGTATFKRLEGTLKARGARSTPLHAGLNVSLGSGAELRVLADLESGTALVWQWGGFRALLPGGVAPGDLPEPLPDGLALLVLGPADLKNLAAEDWNDLLQPQVLLVTGGPAPTLPHAIALDDYQWVGFQSDGSRLWLEGQRK